MTGGMVVRLGGDSEGEKGRRASVTEGRRASSGKEGADADPAPLRTLTTPGGKMAANSSSVGRWAKQPVLGSWERAQHKRTWRTLVSCTAEADDTREG